MIKKKKIVFVCHSGKQIDCNPLAIFNALLKNNNDNVKFVWLLQRDLIKVARQKYPNIKIVDYDSWQAISEIRTADVFINNQLMIKFYKLGLKKQRGQLFINTWHGSFGLKKIPLRDDINIVKSSCDEFDYFISNSDFETNVYKESFGKQVEALHLGHPRNDVLFSNKASALAKNEICNELHIDKNTKIVLWMPSARDAFDENNFDLNIDKLCNCLNKRFGGKWIVLYRFHRNNVDDYGKIFSQKAIDVTYHENLNKLILSSSVLITDYSSVICDYILTKKPAFIFSPDYDQFTSFNSLYWDLKKLPFGIAKNEDELFDNINKFVEKEYLNGVNDWLSEVNCIEDGKASEKVSKIILEHLSGKYDELLKYTNVISPTIAEKLGYKKLFFTFRNVGDQLILQRALEIYAEKNGINKILIGTLTPELWNNNKLFHIIRLKEVKLHCYSEEVFSQLQSCDITPVFLSQEKLIKNTTGYIRTFGPYHIVGNIASKLGVSGRINVDLSFYLSEQERSFGRLAKEGDEQIAIMTGGLQRYKTYDEGKLQTVVDKLSKPGRTIVQIGVTKDPLLKGVVDLRGQISLRQVAAVLSHSDLFIGGIGGLMHLANAVRCPSVVIYTSAETDYIVNYSSNINVHPPKTACTLCQEGRHCPWTSPCKAIRAEDIYSCIDSISPESVYVAAEKLLKNKKQFIPTFIDIKANKVKGLDDYYKTGFKLIKDKKRNISFMKINPLFYAKKSKIGSDKTCVQYIAFGAPIASVIESSTAKKYRFLFMKMSFNKNHYKNDIISKVQNGNCIEYGNKEWLKSVENYPVILSKYIKYLDNDSIKILEIALKRKRLSITTQSSSCDSLADEEINFEKVSEYLSISDVKVGDYFDIGDRKSIYQYGRYLSVYKTKALFSFYHKCFSDIYAQHIGNGDIIDVGAGIGDSSMVLAHTFHRKVYAIEASPAIYKTLEENIKLNNMDCVIPKNIGFKDKSGVANFTNKNNTLNYVHANKMKGDISLKFITLDEFISNNNINLSLLRVATNGCESSVLKGAKKSIENFRPILVIDVSSTGKDLFDVFNFMYKNFKDEYQWKVVKCHERHATNGLNFIAIPYAKQKI